MSLDGTYAGLQASIATLLRRTDLTAAIPDYITLAESQMQRRLVGRQAQGLPIPRPMVARADCNITSGMEYPNIPSDFAGPIKFTLTFVDTNGSTREIDLRYTDPTNLERMKARLLDRCGTTVPWCPLYYSIVGSSIQIFPLPQQTYTGELTYIQRFPALSNSNPGNWILTSYPDAYLYGAAVQSAPHLKADDRIAMWGTLFSAALDDICNADPLPPDDATLRSDLSILTWFDHHHGTLYSIETDTF